MIVKYGNRAIAGIGAGVMVMAVFIGIGLYLRPVSENLALLLLLGFIVGVVIYTWGCSCLATAKGHPTAIILSVVLGIAFPAIVLLALPDRNAHRSHRRRG